MKDNNTSSSNKNKLEAITYSIVGGVVCLSFMPVYIPYVVAYDGLIGSLYGVIKILDKYKDTEDMKFVSKEKVVYFKDKE